MLVNGQRKRSHKMLYYYWRIECDVQFAVVTGNRVSGNSNTILNIIIIRYTVYNNTVTTNMTLTGYTCSVDPPVRHYWRAETRPGPVRPGLERKKTLIGARRTPSQVLQQKFETRSFSLFQKSISTWNKSRFDFVIRLLLVSSSRGFRL